MPEDDFYALLRREKAAASPVDRIVQEVEQLLASMHERGAEGVTINLALRHILDARGG